MLVLLGVSIACNLYQKQLLGELSKKTEKVEKPAGGGKEAPNTAPENVVAPANISPTLNINTIPILGDGSSKTEDCSPVLVFERCYSDVDYDDEGIPYCKSITLSLKNLAESNFKEILDAIKIKPDPLQLDRIVVRDGSIEFQGLFEVAKEYMVFMPKGTLTRYGKTEKDASFVARTSGGSPVLSFTDEGRYYPIGAGSGRKCTIALDVFRLDKVNVTIWRVPRENMDVAGVMSARRYSETAEEVMIKMAEKAYDVPSCMKRKQRLALDIGEMLKELKPGLYMIKMDPRASSNYDDLPYYFGGDRELEMVLSDLGISATAAPYGKGLAVFVRSLDTQKGVANCKVHAYTSNRVLLAEGVTGQDGTVLLDYSKVDKRKVTGTFFVVAEKDGDVTYLALNENCELSNAEFNNEGRGFEEMRAFIYTERGIYRPGEVVEASVFVRRNTKDGFVGCALRCEMSLSDSEGRIVGRKMIDTNKEGFGSASFQLNSDARGENYVVKCGIPGEKEWDFHTIYVGAFTPDRIKLKLSATKEVLHEDEVAELKVSGKYYFGKELEGGFLKMNMFLVGSHYPRHWKDYSVGGKAINGDVRELGTIWEDQYQKLNDEVFQVPNIRRAVRNACRDLDAPVKLRVIATAKEGGERAISASTDFIYSPQRLYIGLKKAADKDRDVEIDCRLLTFNKDDLREDDKIKAGVLLVKMEWKYALIEDGGVRKRQWREEVVSERRLDAVDVASNGTVLTIKELDYGHYKLYVGSSVLDFYHWWGDGGSSRSSNPSVLTVTSDAEKYTPGGTATLTFDAAKGALLIAAGESKLEDARAIDTVPGKNIFKQPIPAHVVGDSYFVELSLLTSGKTEDDDMSRSYALLRLPIDQASRKAKLEIQAPEIAEPGKEIDVTLKAQDFEGKPLDGTVQLYAVDEGILALTDYKTPDIFGFLHGKYYCDFQTYDIYSRIFPKAGMKAPRKIGGDGAFGGLRMEDIKNKENAIVVLPAADIVNGVVSLKMKVPQHFGAMRLIAVAGCGNKVGSIDRELKVRNKADVSSVLPSIAAPGDAFQGIFKVVNHEYDSEDAVLTVACGKGISPNGKVTKKIKVKRGGSAMVHLPFKVVGEGAQEINYTLEMGGTKVEQRDYVNVRPAIPASTATDFVVLKPGEEYKPSQEKMSKVLDSKVSVASSVSIAAAEALEWLNQYPYGCLEQTTSCAFPFLATDKMLKAGIIDKTLAASGKGKVELGVRRVLAMQRGSNGFASWIDSNSIWYEVSTFAAHFLALANSPLFTENARNNTVEFLLRRFDNVDTDFQQAYNGYVLALLGNKSKANVMLQKLEYEKQLGGMAKFMYAAALFKLGYAKQVLPALNEALEKLAWNDTNVSWYFSSPAMRKAFVLSIAMEIVPDNPANAKLALELAKSGRKDGSGWGVTGTNAWVTYGLAAYGAYHKPQPTEVEVFANGKSTRTKLEGSQALAGCDRIVNHGPGQLYISARLRGIPKVPASNGSISIHKEYRDSDGNLVTKAKCGDLLTVQLRIRHNGWISNGVLLDLLPGGFEIENQALATRANVALGDNSKYEMQHIEMLEDRYLLFFEDKEGGCNVSYNIRAVIPGKYKIPGASVDDMYNPDVNGTFGTKGIIEITE